MDTVTLRSCRTRQSVIRTSSLKETERHHPNSSNHDATLGSDDEDNDDVFVRADPVKDPDAAFSTVRSKVLRTHKSNFAATSDLTLLA